MNQFVRWLCLFLSRVGTLIDMLANQREFIIHIKNNNK